MTNVVPRNSKKPVAFVTTQIGSFHHIFSPSFLKANNLLNAWCFTSSMNNILTENCCLHRCGRVPSQSARTGVLINSNPNPKLLPADNTDGCLSSWVESMQLKVHVYSTPRTPRKLCFHAAVSEMRSSLLMSQLPLNWNQLLNVVPKTKRNHCGNGYAFFYFCSYP